MKGWAASLFRSPACLSKDAPIINKVSKAGKAALALPVRLCTFAIRSRDLPRTKPSAQNTSKSRRKPSTESS